MAEALNKLEEEPNKTATREEILEYLAFSTYKQGIYISTEGYTKTICICCLLSRQVLQEIFWKDLHSNVLLYIITIGNVKEALQLTHELLKIVPFHQRGLSNIRHYEDILLHQQQGAIQFHREMPDGYVFLSPLSF